MKTVLHAGCGFARLPDWLKGYREVRLDIDPETKPQLLRDFRNLGEIGPYDAILCNHALEHLYPHEAVPALKGFRKVLKKGGFAAVFVPDLEGVQATDDILYFAPVGPISGFDLIYGHRFSIPASPYMAHHNGFNRESLEEAMTAAGFSGGTVARLSNYNLLAIGVK